jgi:uncharacterized protein
VSKHLWAMMGLIALGFGVIGIVVPILPTTPFLLVAAFCFARSSPRLHNWLLVHPTFGRLISDWQKYGVIRRTSKIIAVVMMAATCLVSWLLQVSVWVLAIQVAALACVSVFILTRPSIPNHIQS